MLNFKNFDLENIITPAIIGNLEDLLVKTNYDREKTKLLINGFRDGFPIGYEGNRKVKKQSPNLKFRVGNETILWNKVMKKVREKRYAGPYATPPFDYYIQSLIGLVPKDNGYDTRLIFHLSHPRNGSSVNSCTPEHLCKVTYSDFDEAVKMCMGEGRGCHIAKSDMKAAFRNLGIRKKDWPLLLMKAKNPINKRFYYFVDKCLPFGSSISCAHFQAFSNCVAHIVRYLSKNQ